MCPFKPLSWKDIFEYWSDIWHTVFSGISAAALMAFIWKLDVQRIVLTDIAICRIKLTELTSFNFHYNGAVAPKAIALGGSFSRAGLIRVNKVMLSTWLASILLIVLDKKTQAMILGNPIQEPALNIGDSVNFFSKKWSFLGKFHDSRHNLQKSQALKEKRNSRTRMTASRNLASSLNFAWMWFLFICWKLA